MNIVVELGHVAPSLEVLELTIRGVSLDEDWGPEFDQEFGPVIPRTELRVQGRLRNQTSKSICGICYDVSYYDRNGRFLGLDRSSWFEDDDLDPADFHPLDMPLTMPEETHRCVFNAKARRRTWRRRWF